ncbi:hypothetical protein TURU_002345 [Turdus rufiventris]|nr:hypothetical protein TURU_002345 [Turdus rufiventris]
MAGAGPIQEDLQKLKMEKTNLKGNAEAVDICDLRKATERTELGLRQQVEMDFKTVLDPEKTDNKSGLKHPNEETRLPLITKKKSAPLCRQEPGKGPRVSSPWALPAFHCLAGGDIPKGALRLSGQRLILPAAKWALPAPPAVARAAPVPEFPRQQQEPAVASGSQLESHQDLQEDYYPYPIIRYNTFACKSISNLYYPPHYDSLIEFKEGPLFYSNWSRQENVLDMMRVITQGPRSKRRLIWGLSK